MAAAAQLLNLPSEAVSLLPHSSKLGPKRFCLPTVSFAPTRCRRLGLSRLCLPGSQFLLLGPLLVKLGAGLAKRLASFLFGHGEPCLALLELGAHATGLVGQLVDPLLRLSPHPPHRLSCLLVDAGGGALGRSLLLRESSLGLPPLLLEPLDLSLSLRQCIAGFENPAPGAGTEPLRRLHPLRGFEPALECLPLRFQLGDPLLSGGQLGWSLLDLDPAPLRRRPFVA